MVLPFNSSKQIEAVETAIQSFYQDESQTDLRPSVDAKEMVKLNRLASRLKGKAKTELLPKVQLVSQKMQVQSYLDELYQEDSMFHPNVDEHTIAERTQGIEWVLADEATHKYDALLLHAYNQWQVIQTVQDDIATLAKQTRLNRQQIPSIIQSIQSINRKLTFVDEQPHLQESLESYKKFLRLFIQALMDSHAQQPYDSATLLPLFESDMLTNQLADTTLDVRPKVSLTFDDGPNEEYTTQVLDILSRYNIQGTFFVLGRFVEENPDIARRIVNEGHIIANHSYDHPDFAQISDYEVRDQINSTQRIIYNATGVYPTLYRMPYGSGGERVFRLIPGLTSITWNTDTNDWKIGDATKIFNHIVTQLTDDSLILLHDTSQASVDVLEPLIEHLKQLNYKFVLPTELEFDYRY
ncbi:polysaccharide deacetylase family protein [Fundicoccus sp. Sow4_H7]|uniref:polysaccharide deacetylase family protein n=1 Tax=Fundicoccus sp. Sow4_H7 TaxID=3438784 RepID=UPI003F918CA5